MHLVTQVQGICFAREVICLTSVLFINAEEYLLTLQKELATKFDVSKYFKEKRREFQSTSLVMEPLNPVFHVISDSKRIKRGDSQEFNPSFG
jgi:hypothetical protein